MTDRFGIIADDFTGATDVASLIARHGVRVVVHAGLPEVRASGDISDVNVHVIALKCRTVPVDEAIAQASAALDWLRGAGCTRFYWKYCSTFDSTPTGNIGPVAEALMGALALDRTVYAPSFPENGRTVYKGHLFVGDEALHDSPMKDHPLTPMRDANLCRLLAPQVRGGVGLIPWQTVRSGADAARRAAAGAGATHLVLDALNDADLATLGAAFTDLPLATGGSAFAASLHAARAGPAVTAQPPHPPEGATLILSGSCSRATCDQVSRHVSKGVTALQITAESTGAQATDAWLRDALARGHGMVYSTTDPETLDRAKADGGANAAERIETEMARLARRAFDLGARRFIVAGGETSGAVTQALEARRLLIGGEIAPGVPWCLADTPRGPVALVLKSGNFGDPDFFDRAHRILEEATACTS